ncbi:YunG family protein [Dactylosporangium sp. CA-233914]|uniref:YunG family protein n=1 Tax=Dactylosporangium sp. CA-233914 TaxID=3239934 RepID=UPI003D8C0761
MLLPLLRRSWGPETCDPSDLADWHPGNPSRGQGGPTALVVREVLGGDLIRGRVTAGGEPAGDHWWNRLPDGTDLDLTRDQFRPGELVLGAELVCPPEGPPTRCRGQHAILRHRVLTALSRAAPAPGPSALAAGFPRPGLVPSQRSGHPASEPSALASHGATEVSARSSLRAAEASALASHGAAEASTRSSLRAAEASARYPRPGLDPSARSLRPTLAQVPVPDPSTPPLRLALALLVDPGGAVLLRRRSPTAFFEPGQWALPAARLQPASEPLTDTARRGLAEEAARRALAEEAGIEFTARLHHHWNGTLPDVTGRTPRVELTILAGAYDLGDSGILADDLSATDLAPTAAVALQALIRSSRASPVRAETAARRAGSA